jgi:hypothetical protein
MPAPRRFELDEAVNRPGTYYNPQTEMLLVVDDGTALDADLFEEPGDADDEATWVLIGDEAPVDETARDEAIERFEASHHPGASGAVDAAHDDEEDDIPELEPDEEDAY